MENLEREILIAVCAQKLRSIIFESSRELGAIFKARGIEKKEAQRLILDIYKEAIETLKDLDVSSTPGNVWRIKGDLSKI